MEPIPELPASGDLDEPAMIGTVTPRDLHEFVALQVLSRYARPGARAVDLGAGPGAMCERLSSLGCQVLAVDRDRAVFEGNNRFVAQDLHQDFVLNAYLWLLLGILFRLPKLAHAAPLAHAAQMTTALATQSSHPGTH
jgi:hypothetical protein